VIECDGARGDFLMNEGLPAGGRAIAGVNVLLIDTTRTLREKIFVAMIIFP
jgi:hypothetical protein